MKKEQRRVGIRIGTLVGGAMCVAAPATARAERCADNGSPTTPAYSQDGHITTEPRDECIERNIYLMPGLQTTYFQPAGGLGPFFGGGVELAPYQWSHNNDHFGPSQGSLIIGASMLQSTKVPGTMGLFDVGATASLERNSSRRWMIPYFGAYGGVLTHQQLPTSGYVYPLAGLHLYWHHNLMVDAEGGYHFPFQDIDTLRGPRAQVSARFSLW
jgi:hypothetical protein